MEQHIHLIVHPLKKGRLPGHLHTVTGPSIDIFINPSSYIYFDTGRNLSFYFEGGQWQVSAALPAGIKLNVSDYVTLEMDTDKPYQFHSDVVKKHPPGYLKKAKGKDKDKKKDKGKDKKKWD